MNDVPTEIQIVYTPITKKKEKWKGSATCLLTIPVVFSNWSSCISCSSCIYLFPCILLPSDCFPLVRPASQARKRREPMKARRNSLTLMLAVWFLTRLIFDLEDGGDTFLRNVGSYTDYTAPYPRKYVLTFMALPVKYSHWWNIFFKKLNFILLQSDNFSADSVQWLNARYID
jgi:hypothetical protein